MIGGPARARARSDELLQASRRLDWRFLLPEPSPGRVLYIGPPRGALIEALGMLELPLTAAEGPGGVEGPAEFDLAVVPAPTAEALRAAAGALRPGGHLYAEVHGPLARGGGGRRGALSSARAAARVLAEAGMGPAELHWHWPSFNACTRIIPLARWEALSFVAGGPRPGLAATAARILAGAGVATALAPHISLIARR